MKSTSAVALPICWSALFLLVAVTRVAFGADAPVPVGMIEGRVVSASSGDALEGARVSVAAAGLETFSDADGKFRLVRVPAGVARVKIFFTGLRARTDDVAVAAGAIAHHEVELAGDAFRATSPSAAVVRLPAFAVEAAREMTGSAYAINEERFAPNIKQVLSTDEFGLVPGGSGADFLKFVPGLEIGTSDENGSSSISINGVPANNVPVTMDGFSLATAGNAVTGRSADVDLISINNAARIEIAYSPTPESPGGALAGTVNLVPRSAFERSRPSFTGSVYLMMRDNARDFHRTAGPLAEPTRNVHPGFDFSYIAPVNKRFGYTLSAGYSTQYGAGDSMQNTWRGVGTPTNGTTFPHTTPDRPYLSSYLLSDGPGVTSRRSVGATVDYRLSPNDRLSFSLQYSSFTSRSIDNELTFNVNRVLPGDFSLTSTRGAAGAGSLQFRVRRLIRFNEIYMPTFVWRHAGPLYRAEGGLGLSRAFNYRNRNNPEGFFTVFAQRTGVTVAFDDITPLRPRVITVTDGATGRPVDPFNLASYALTTTTQIPQNVADLQRSAYGNIQREFHGRLPLVLKGGVDVRQSVRDFRGGNSSVAFVGNDGRASTTPVGSDDSAAPFVDALFSQRVAPFGFPQMQAVRNRLVWDDYRATPQRFLETDANRNTTYRQEVTNSKHAQETIYATYLRADASFLERRLKLVGGLRAEQTNVVAEGPLTDPNRNIQRDASGRPILGANGRPLPITSVPLAVSQLTYLDRAAHARKEYLRLFPNLNVSYNFRDDLVARAAYYHSVGRPNFNQYAGGLMLPDTETAPGPGNQITVGNAGIKAWSARTVNLRLEYYFPAVGQISVGAYRRDFENFFGATEFQATPEFLELYGLDPGTYGDYRVVTQYNLPGIVRMTGVNFNYKQALTFLPHWARGVQVFANASAQRATGPNLGAFTGANFVPRTASWGINLRREKFGLRANWNYRGRYRRGLVAAGTGIDPATYNWGSERLVLDLQGEYSVSQHVALFAVLRNVSNVPTDNEIAGPDTPDLAAFSRRNDTGALWTFGVKGTW